LYGERRRETSHLDEDPDQAAHQKALQSLDAGSVRHPPFAVRFGDSQQIDLGLLTICECCLVELIGVNTEAEVASRENENRPDEGNNGAEDPDAKQGRLKRLVGERNTIPDCRSGEQRSKRARARQHRCSAGAQACHDISLFIEGASG
jgi:hypothetical protein